MTNENNTTSYYQKSIEQTAEGMETSTSDGLSSSEVDDRLEEVGPNEIESGDEISKLEILWDNTNNLIVYLLAAASVLSFIMGDPIEGVAIIIAILLSILTGFFSELTAQQSVNALQGMIHTHANVLRDGTVEEIEASQVVPGDILVLEEGDSVVADGRLIDSNNLATMEAALTGESTAIEKDHDVVFDDEQALGDQVNAVFSGTTVTRGKGQAIVTATAMDTEVGKIADLTNQDDKQASPLDKELHKISRFVIALAAVAAVIVVIVGIIQGEPLGQLVHLAIILAVSSIPEALPAVSTLTLARGMKIMAEEQALVKSLSAVETLGSTSVISSDKTGTLTENQMTVEHLVLADDLSLTVEGKGYYPEGDFYQGEEQVDLNADDHPHVVALIRHGLMGSNAKLYQDDNDDYAINGDPTDGALVVLAEKIGIDRDHLQDQGFEKVDEIPFSSDNKYNAVRFRSQDQDEDLLIVKGAPDKIFSMSDIDEEEKAYWEDQTDQLTQQGMRVIGLSTHSIDQSDDQDLEDILESYGQDLKIEGLYGIIDPPRQDVKESVELCQAAGIKVKMITGDHPTTASIIAQEIGIDQADQILTGEELDDLYDSDSDQFQEEVEKTAVFARVSPENKLQIVKTLQDKDEVVAMTGDGVNDAPALSGADIGVAMGIRGTEVAKEASEMILTNDKFSTIVKAVEIGRIIFSNIKKYISFLFACNVIEILTILLAIIFLLPTPILPLHILYLNLVVDIFPAIALGFEPAESDIMEEPPRDKDQGLVQGPFLARILINGAVIAIASFLFYLFEINQGFDLPYVQTSVFAFMAVAQLYHLLNVRKSESFGLDRSLLDNKLLIGAVILSAVLLVIALYVPFMNTVLGTVPLTGQSWVVLLLAGLIPTFVNALINRLFMKSK